MAAGVATAVVVAVVPCQIADPNHLSTYAERLAEVFEASGVEHLRAAGRALLSRTGPRRHVEGGWAPGCPARSES